MMRVYKVGRPRCLVTRAVNRFFIDQDINNVDDSIFAHSLTRLSFTRMVR